MLQGLPPSVAKEAIYLLSGQVPAEALLHCRIFSLFGQISRLHIDHPLHRLAARQLVMRNSNPGSWFTQLSKLAERYQIDISQALFFPWKKDVWKQYCKKSIIAYWKVNLLNDASQKSSLSRILWSFNINMKQHGVWKGCHGSPKLARSAEVRVRFMTARYTCAGSPWVRGPLGEIAECKVCGDQPETLLHIVTSCSTILSRTSPLIDQLKNLLSVENKPSPQNRDELMSLLINGDCFFDQNSESVISIEENSDKAQTLTNRIFGVIHSTREKILNDLTVN